MFTFGIVKETIIHWDDTSLNYNNVYASVTLEGKMQGNKFPRDEYTGDQEEAGIVIELRARVIQNNDIIVSLIAEYNYIIFYNPDEISYQNLQEVAEYARKQFSDYFDRNKSYKIRSLTVPYYHSDLSGLQTLYDLFRQQNR